MIYVNVVCSGETKPGSAAVMISGDYTPWSQREKWKRGAIFGIFERRHIY
jgi:hypothetical protein